MSKRGENIYKRKDNRWEGRYYIIRPDGTKKSISVYAQSYTETKNKLLIGKEQARQNTANLPKCRLTVQELLLNWLAAKQNTLKLSSYLHYEKLIKNQLLPELGKLPLDKLTVKNLSAFMLQKQQAGRLDKQGGLSGKTITDMLTIIKSAVKMAAVEYNLPQAAAIADIKSPSVKQKSIDTFTDYEIALICRNILQTPTVANLAVLLSLNTGLRLGEVCALRWEDIDWQEQTLSVRRNVQRMTLNGKSQLLIQSPKSESSRRTIPLTAEILLLLQELKKSARGEQNEYVFGGNKPLEPRTLQYNFAVLLKKCGIRQRNFHTLRHTFATRFVAAGADIKSLSEILGHAKVNITMQLYVHPTMAQKRQNMEAVNILRGLCA